MHANIANDFLKTYRTQATAFPVHLTIRLHDPIHGHIQCTYSNACHCLGNLPRQFRAFVAADTIVHRSETKIRTCNYHACTHLYFTYIYLYIICIDDRRKHTFLSPTDTGFKKKIISQFPCIFYPCIFVKKHL